MWESQEAGVVQKCVSCLTVSLNTAMQSRTIWTDWGLYKPTCMRADMLDMTNTAHMGLWYSGAHQM